MADAGELAEFVDSGNVSLTNVTDTNTIFKQLRNVRVFITTNVTKIALESEQWDKQFDLRDFAIEGQIWLTEPELVTWVGYTVQTTNRPPSKSWKVSFAGDDTAITTITGTMRVSNLEFFSEEEGYSWYNFRLESVDGAVAAA